WALGVEARCRALVSDDWAAETHYHKAIDRLGRTSIRGELTRARLLYGEWLRRRNRRADSQVQLRTAHDAFTAMGMEAFADRTAGELLATGESVRMRSDEAPSQLTAQEAQIAGSLARAIQCRDRREVVHQPSHRGMAPEQYLHQAPDHLTQAASHLSRS